MQDITDANSKSAPRIVSSILEYKFPVGTDVNVACSAQAFPVPSFEWSLQEEQVINLRRSSTFSSTVAAAALSRQRSSFTSSSPSEFLSLEKRPDKHIPSSSLLMPHDHHNQDNDAKVDASVMMMRNPSSVATTSLSSLDYHVVSNRAILSIPNAQTSDSGLYVCTTNNSLGEDKKSFVITITGKTCDFRGFSCHLLWIWHSLTCSLCSRETSEQSSNSQ